MRAGPSAEIRPGAGQHERGPAAGLILSGPTGDVDLGGGVTMPAVGRSQRAAGSTEVILLGTGGCPLFDPEVAMASTAIAVDGAIYLVDCGVGVGRQLAAAGYGVDALHGVFVTHHHSDHNADLGTLFLIGWSRIRRRIPAFGPPDMHRYFRDFFELNHQDVEFRAHAHPGRPHELVAPTDVVGEGPVFEDSRVRVSAALVDHPPVTPAFAFRIDTADRSVVVSGDTAYCPRLAEFARGADVLVHEVVHPDYIGDMLAAARSPERAAALEQHLLRSHTTPDQVGAVAAAADVHTLVLSHLVPGRGVPDEEWIRPIRRSFSGQVVVGRDLLVV